MTVVMGTVYLGRDEGLDRRDIERLLRTDPTAPLRIVRHLDAPGGGDDPSAEPLDIEGIDLVIVASLADDAAVDRLAALNFRGTTVVDAAGAYAALTGRIPVRQVDSRWFIATGDFSSLAGSPRTRRTSIIANSSMLSVRTSGASARTPRGATG